MNPDFEQCSICNDTDLTRVNGIIRCLTCGEFFSFGVKQFNELWGKEYSYTALGLRKFRLIVSRAPFVEYFCRSTDQLLKSDLRCLDTALGTFDAKTEAQSLAYFIKQHKPLKELQVILRDSEYLKILLDAIAESQISKLTLVNGCAYLSDYNAGLVRDTLRRNASIRKLLVSPNARNPKMKFIIDGLAQSSTIETLQISECVDSPIVFSTNLKKLTIIGTGSLTAPSASRVNILHDALTANKSIQTLCFTNAHLALISIIEHNTAIKTLQVWSVPVIDDKTTTKLAQILTEHPTLTCVSFGKCPETIENVTLLLVAIQYSKGITKFDATTCNAELCIPFLTGLIRLNKLTSLKFNTCLRNSSETLPDISPFTEALKDPNCSLKELSLSCRAFNYDDMLAIALALEANRSLQVIDISQAIFSKAASLVMQRWLVNNNRLKSIKFDLYSNGDNDEDIDLALIISKNTTIQTLHYNGSITTAETVLDALAVNDTLTDLAIFAEDESFLSKLQDKVVPNNWAIRKLVNLANFRDEDGSDLIETLTTRNKSHQSSMIINTTIIIHSIARDRSVFTQLPREMWLLIFEQLRYPGLVSFKLTAEEIFGRYYK